MGIIISRVRPLEIDQIITPSKDVHCPMLFCVCVFCCARQSNHLLPCPLKQVSSPHSTRPPPCRDALQSRAQNSKVPPQQVSSFLSHHNFHFSVYHIVSPLSWHLAIKHFVQKISHTQQVPATKHPKP